MRYRLGLLIVLLALFPYQVIHADWRIYPEKCVFPNGEILLPRVNNGQLELVSWVTGEVIQVLLNDPTLPLADLDRPLWSRDCSQLLLRFGYAQPQMISFWGVTPTGAQELGRFAAITDYRWYEDENYVVVGSGGQTLVWNLGTGSQFWVAAEFLQTLTWDTARNWLFAVPTERKNTVIALDLGSGQIVGTYPVVDSSGGKRGVHYEVRGEYILVGADHQTSSGGAVWHLTTGWNLQLAGQVRVWQTNHNITLSPDGRYFVLSVGGGGLRVWDLTQLQGESPYESHFSLARRNDELGYRRAAVYWNFMDLRWRDNIILEGAKFTYLSLELYRWNVATNEFIYYDDLHDRVCQDADFIATYPEADLLNWACSS